MAGEEADLVAKKLSVAVPEPVGVDTIEAAPVKALKIQANLSKNILLSNGRA